MQYIRKTYLQFFDFFNGFSYSFSPGQLPDHIQPVDQIFQNTKVKKKVCTTFLEHEKELGKMLQNLGYMYKKAQPKNLVFPEI